METRLTKFRNKNLVSSGFKVLQCLNNRQLDLWPEICIDSRPDLFQGTYNLNPRSLSMKPDP